MTPSELSTLFGNMALLLVRCASIDVVVDPPCSRCTRSCCLTSARASTRPPTPRPTSATSFFIWRQCARLLDACVVVLTAFLSVFEALRVVLCELFCCRCVVEETGALCRCRHRSSPVVMTTAGCSWPSARRWRSFAPASRRSQCRADSTSSRTSSCPFRSAIQRAALVRSDADVLIDDAAFAALRTAAQRFARRNAAKSVPQQRIGRGISRSPWARRTAHADAAPLASALALIRDVVNAANANMPASPLRCGNASLCAAVLDAP